MTVPEFSQGAWPPLALADWQDTYASVHLLTQMLGKTRLALSPAQNHWWHTALYVSARGLATSALPYGTRSIDIELDFIDHRLVVRSADGQAGALALGARPVAQLYREYIDLLRSLDVEVHIWPMPAEIAGAIRFTEDNLHHSYDAAAVQRCWRVLLQIQRVMLEFRSRFIGKCSPVHFWWGGFDLACTRFSGRTAPQHPGGVPNMPDFVAREGYSHECISAGWWPGSVDGPIKEPAFYAYAYPEPAGCATAPVRPDAAYYNMDLHEWVLPYDAVRAAADPGHALTEFLQSTYEAAANLGGWDRASLERPSVQP